MDLTRGMNMNCEQKPMAGANGRLSTSLTTSRSNLQPMPMLAQMTSRNTMPMNTLSTRRLGRITDTRYVTASRSHSSYPRAVSRSPSSSSTTNEYPPPPDDFFRVASIVSFDTLPRRVSNRSRVRPRKTPLISNAAAKGAVLFIKFSGWVLFARNSTTPSPTMVAISGCSDLTRRSTSTPEG